MAKISANDCYALDSFTTDAKVPGEDYLLREHWVLRSDGKVLKKLVGRVHGGELERIQAGYHLAPEKFRADRLWLDTAPEILRNRVELNGIYKIVG